MCSQLERAWTSHKKAEIWTILLTIKKCVSLLLRIQFYFLVINWRQKWWYVFQNVVSMEKLMGVCMHGVKKSCNPGAAQIHTQQCNLNWLKVWDHLPRYWRCHSKSIFILHILKGPLTNVIVRAVVLIICSMLEDHKGSPTDQESEQSLMTRQDHWMWQNGKCPSDIQLIHEV